MGIIDKESNYLIEDNCTFNTLLQLSYQIKANILAVNSKENLRNYLKNTEIYN